MELINNYNYMDHNIRFLFTYGMAEGSRQLAGGPREGSGGRPHRNQGRPGGRMHSEAVCISRQYAIKAECNRLAYCLLPITYQ